MLGKDLYNNPPTSREIEMNCVKCGKLVENFDEEFSITCKDCPPYQDEEPTDEQKQFFNDKIDELRKLTEKRTCT